MKFSRSPGDHGSRARLDLGGREGGRTSSPSRTVIGSTIVCRLVGLHWPWKPSSTKKEADMQRGVI